MFVSCRPKRHEEEGATGALVDREFRTSQRALNVLSVRAGLSEQATKAPRHARSTSRLGIQLDDRRKTLHQLFGLAGLFELDLDHVSDDRDHGTRAKGLVAHGIARGKVL